MKSQYSHWDIRLPQDIYAKQLETINEINFTRREVDILTCVLSGKTAKQIAAFLSISPKTVENHIRNIMLKTGCRTQSVIINLIEKSDKFSLFKNHYASLLIQHTFILELKKIATIATRKLNCLIIYNKTLKSAAPFFSYFLNDLQLAGVDTCALYIQKNEPNRYLSNNTKFSAINTILCHLESESTENGVLNEIIQFAHQRFCRLIFISIAKSPTLTASQKLSRFETMMLQEPQNYYFFVFELLKKLLAPIDLQESISVFEQKYKLLSETHPMPAQQSKIKSQIAWGNSILNILKKPKSLASALGIICLIFLSVILSNQLSNLFTHTKEINPKKTTNDIGSQSSKEHAAMEWNVPRQDNIFVGRTKLLEELYVQLHPSHKTDKGKTNIKENIPTNKTTIINICAGLGGIGKTQLALKYINQFKDFYTLKAWFYAEHITQLKEQYIDFARSLGYDEKNLSFSGALSYIKKSLPQYPGWLFIYDNVTNYQEINDFLPKGEGYIIMTTRQQHWPSSFKILDIDIMTENDALDLLQSLIKRNINHEKSHATTLVKTLGFLPLAVAQAGAYIQQNNISIAEYLTLYQKHEQELLSEPTMPLGVDSLPAAVTWDISLQAINQGSRIIDNVSLPIELLTVCAYLAPEKISRSLLLTWLKVAHPKIKSPLLKLNTSLAKLRQYSMIHDDSNEKITVHRLVQTIMRYKHSNVKNCLSLGFPTQNVAWYDILLKAIHGEISNNNDSTMKQRDLFPHLTSLLQHYENLWPKHVSQFLGKALYDLGLTLNYALYEPKNSIPYLERALLIFKQHYSKDQLQIAKILNDLGNVYGTLGEHKQKCLLLQQSLAIKKTIYGDNHVEYIKTVNDLAKAYFYLGAYSEVRQLLEERIKKWKYYYNNEYGEYAKSLNTLASTYGDLGEYEYELDLLKKSLDLHKQYYGDKNEGYAKILNSLACTYGFFGNYQKKYELLKQALAIYEFHYSTKYIEYVRVLCNLGEAYGELGDYVQQRNILENQVLPFNKKHYGVQHGMYAVSLLFLANAYGNLGYYSKKIALLEEALEIFKKQRSIHSVTYYAKPLISLANAIGATGNYEKKLALSEEALNIIKEQYGVRHIEYFIALHTMANAFGSLGDHAKNIQLLEEVLSNYNKFYGPTHDAVGSCLRDLASAHLMLGHYKEVQPLLEQALNIKERIYDQQHIEYAHTLHILGDFYIKTQNCTQAQTILSQVLQIKKSFYGDQHVEYAKSLYALAENYMGLKNYSESETLLKQVVKINERFYGKQHPRTQEVLSKLAEIKISKQ
jgi:tetratricopeptide (TPR) repeat protein/DNA-binding CsgD family transcriptional regulator